ncbi:MAG: hypothetical protein V7L29_29570 [Nostoc sp.]
MVQVEGAIDSAAIALRSDISSPSHKDFLEISCLRHRIARRRHR